MTTEAHCPYCQNSLEKPPTRKKKCPHCGEYMYVRGGKAYTEKQVEEFDFLRLWLGRLEEQYGISEAEFETHRENLSEQFGFRASSSDTVWRVLNSLITKMPNYPTNEHRYLYLDMAQLVRSEGKDPRPHIELANKVHSDLVKKEISEHMAVFELDPNTKWTFFSAYDELVCPSCKNAENNDWSAADAINVPLQCTGDYGCRCGVITAAETEEAIGEREMREKDSRPRWKFWG